MHDESGADAISDAGHPRPAGQSLLGLRIGQAIQQQRLRRGLTQAQLAAQAGLSLKYVGEIERGEANTTLDTIQRLAGVLGWDPMMALDGVREPITEGIRVLFLNEMRTGIEKMQSLEKFLVALDPQHHPDSARTAVLRLLVTPGVQPHARVSGRRRQVSGTGVPREDIGDHVDTRPAGDAARGRGTRRGASSRRR